MRECSIQLLLLRWPNSTVEVLALTLRVKFWCASVSLFNLLLRKFFLASAVNENFVQINYAFNGIKSMHGKKHRSTNRALRDPSIYNAYVRNSINDYSLAVC